MRTERALPAIAVGLLMVLAACAPRTAPPPPLPAALTYPEFVYPVVPARLQRVPGAEAIDRGWRYLQTGDLRGAEREFGTALRRNPALFPASAGVGYVALARGDHHEALEAFDRALAGDPSYAPALVGRGQTLLALGRDAEALAAYEAAAAADRSLAATLGSRIEVLRFRGVQGTIETARRARAAGRLDEARAAYERALEASPDSAFLHRELGDVERRRGNSEEALRRFRRAVDLDPGDAAAWIAIGELLEQRGDFTGAERAYQRAAEIEPHRELEARLAAIAEKAREKRLPQEYRAIASAAQITRGDLAALIGIRLERLLKTVRPRQIVITDARNHWAAPWITEVARAGIMDPFENHTFQPHLSVRRGDLAAAASRILGVLASRDPALRQRLTERPKFADMGAGHLSYQAAAASVAAGVLTVAGDSRFQVGRLVTGAEAVEAVERLRELARVGD
jgi:tetratricopeptide (TPR) repeat protein